MSITGLPLELEFNILLNLSLSDLARMRRVNRKYNRIYNDDNFWRMKLKHDFNIKTKNDGLSWREFYFKEHIRFEYLLKKLSYGFDESTFDTCGRDPEYVIYYQRCSCCDCDHDDINFWYKYQCCESCVCDINMHLICGGHYNNYRLFRLNPISSIDITESSGARYEKVYPANPNSQCPCRQQ